MILRSEKENNRGDNIDLRTDLRLEEENGSKYGDGIKTVVLY